jgi:hypothetical protein
MIACWAHEGGVGGAGAAQPTWCSQRTGGALARGAERLELLVPGAAEDLVDRVLDRRARQQRRSDHGAQSVLGDQQVAVQAGDRVEQA